MCVNLAESSSRQQTACKSETTELEESGSFSVEIHQCKMRLSQLIFAWCEVTAMPLSFVVPKAYPRPQDLITSTC